MRKEINNKNDDFILISGNWSGVKSIATKVLLQINTKLGGSPWLIQMPMK
jgi:hypothetical protein